MIADPKRLQIVLAVQAALRRINGEAGGYFFAVQEASVSTELNTDLWSLPYASLPYLVVVPDSGQQDEYQPANVLKVVFPLLIVGRMDAEAGSIGTERLRTWEQLFADIERALTRDITLGGLVVDTRITDRQAGVDVGSSPQVHVRVNVRTTFYRQYGAP